MNGITKKKLIKYFGVTQKVLEKAIDAPENLNITDSTKQEIINMVEKYLSNTDQFLEKNDLINAFASLSYAQGWLDAGTRLGIFDIHYSELFEND